MNKMTVAAALAALAVGAAANGNCDFLKAPYGRKGQRGNWKWDYPFEEEDRGASNSGWEIKNISFAATGELEYGLSSNRPEGVEFAAALVFPASVSQDFRASLKKLLCGLNCQPERIWRVQGDQIQDRSLRKE